MRVYLYLHFYKMLSGLTAVVVQNATNADMIEIGPFRSASVP